jgi:lipase maturation factor 1
LWRAKNEESSRPKYKLTRSVFLRGLGLTYMAAFASMAVQVDGLIGSHGILPVADYLDRARRVLGPGLGTYWRLPTLLWLDSSDRALHALCWGGFLVGAALFAGFLPGICTLLLWLSYLSIVVAGQIFLGYQWDSLLLETGLLAVLMTPLQARLERATDRPWWFTLWLVRWLLFRLMFQSGLVKLTSHDPTWWHLSALDFHFETQPLPAWTSWYVHQMPAWFHRLSVSFMFYAEMVAPFFIFGPRPIRLVGFGSIVLLQLLIAATGNYGFFNLLAVVLCLTLLDDRDWKWLGRNVNPRRKPAETGAEDDSKACRTWRTWSIPRRMAVGAVGMIIIIVTTAEMLERIWPGVVPTALVELDQYVDPLRSTNSYGLFAVMTTERPEIIVEGSEDGTSWKPYQFRWKPGELNRRPGFTTPHMPRLDWQLWFAALAGDCRGTPWFLRFEQKLLEGTPEVLSLVSENPFPNRPPRFVRARLDLYKFTRWGSRDWWIRQDRGLFCPPIELRSFDRAD